MSGGAEDKAPKLVRNACLGSRWGPIVITFIILAVT